jgi:hypothetical protein
MVRDAATLVITAQAQRHWLCALRRLGYDRKP